VLWYISVILAPGRLRQEDLKVEAKLGYTVRSCLKSNRKKKIKKKEERKDI
jgi:hypothetical protein